MTQPAGPLLDRETLPLLADALRLLEAGFTGLPQTGASDVDHGRVAEVLADVATRLQDNYPYFHPLYAGQMLKPPHPVARLAYALALWINPNNHALDGGRASSSMEKEAVADLARMVGWETHLGHICSGGTVANMEALWIARELAPGATLLASENAHYTHARLSAVLGIPYEPVPADDRGRMDMAALEERLAQGGVGTVVATIGTTATGSIDPLEDLLSLRDRFGFRVHADAAYGGYFRLAANLSPEARRAFDALGEVESIVIDPHKHGLQPYGCGCVLFRDPAVGRFYRHDSPYTYFSSDDLHLGEISLECSRPGASAVALWATQRLLPLWPDGTFARDLARCREAALGLHALLTTDDRVVPGFAPELDIVFWTIRAPVTSEASALASRVFAEAAARNLHLALATLPVAYLDLPVGMTADTGTVTCLRSVLMKPEHGDWLDEIWTILDAATTATVGS